LKFLCGLALPFAVPSTVWQPVLNQGMEQVSFASFAKARKLSTTENQEQDISVNGGGFGLGFFGVLFCFY